MRKLPWLILLITVLCATALATAVFVQTGTGGLFSGNPTATNAITPSAGNTLLVAVLCYTTPCTGLAVTDTKLQTYTIVATCNNPLAQGDSLNILETDSVAAGSTTVTITSTSGNFVEGYVLEFSGLASSAFDKSACASSATTTSNTATTSFANELVLGFAAGSGPTVGAGFTITHTSQSGAAYVQLGEYLNVTSTGAQAATWGAGATKGSIVATFKAASQPGGVKRLRGAVVGQ